MTKTMTMDGREEEYPIDDTLSLSTRFVSYPFFAGEEFTIMIKGRLRVEGGVWDDDDVTTKGRGLRAATMVRTTTGERRLPDR